MYILPLIPLPILNEIDAEHTVGIYPGNFYKYHSLQSESTVNNFSSFDTFPVEAFYTMQKKSCVSLALWKEMNRSPYLKVENLLNDHYLFQLPCQRSHTEAEKRWDC